MARWTRAERALRVPTGARVLDLGCAFGFGTRYLSRRYDAYGHDLSASYIARARKSVPNATFTVGGADAVPYPDAHFAGAVLLDVLEHVRDERAVVQELARVLSWGAPLVLSVPNRGLLGSLDSLNLYQRIGGSRYPAPTDDPSWPEVRLHRHYDANEIRTLLAPYFAVQIVTYSGLGIAEALNLLLLLLFRARWNAPRVYAVAQYLYFGMYLLEDLIPTGDWGYHMMIQARRTDHLVSR